MAPYSEPIVSVLLLKILVLQAMNPRLLLMFLLMAQAHAYPIPVRSENVVSGAENIYYMNGKIRCLRCSPGMFVYNGCTTPDTESTCASCIPGKTYSEYLTGLNQCHSCTICRMDQVEVSPCTVTMNTKCKCKEGTYCPPGSPCEMCQKCTTSCPPNQVIQTPCNSTFDAKCGPPEDSNTLAYILGPIAFLIVCAAIIAFYCCYKKKKFNNSRWIPKILTISSICDEAPSEGLEMPFLPQQSKLQLKKNLSENDKNAAINGTFHVFVDMIPTKSFEKFVQRLGLTSNEIDRMELDNKGTYNQQYAMLMLLHQDQRFDVNNWLDILRDFKMGKVAQDINNKLVEKGYWEWSTEQ